MFAGSPPVRALLIFCYALVLLATTTGALKFAVRESELLKVIHKMIGTLLTAAFTAFFFVTGLVQMRILPRALITALFILLVYTAFVNGRPGVRPWVLAVHRIGGGVVFGLSTVLLVQVLVA